MARNVRRRRVCVACDRCGERRSAYLWSHGAVEPVDGAVICECAQSRLRIVTPARGDASGSDEES